MTETRNVTLDDLFRLSGSDIQQLINVIVEKEKKNHSTITEYSPFIKTDHTHEQQVTIFIIEKKINNKLRKLVLMPPSKDSHRKTHEPSLLLSFLPTKEETLPFIADLLTEFFNYCNEKNLTVTDYEILFPMRQCRGVLYLPTELGGKEHSVFCLLDLPHKKLTTYDSQSDESLIIQTAQKINENLYYPDTLGEDIVNLLKDNSITVTYDYQHLKLQKESSFTCGYYVHQCLLSYVALGDVSQFSQIQIISEKGKIQDGYIGTKSKREYLEYYLGHEYVPGIDRSCLTRTPSDNQLDNAGRLDGSDINDFCEIGGSGPIEKKFNTSESVSITTHSVFIKPCGRSASLSENEFYNIGVSPKTKVFG